MSFREFNQSTDIATQLSVVNEVIPLTGAFFSGTDFYTKTYINITSGSAVSGGFWQTVFDGAPTSISSSALVDFTYGHSSASLLQGYSETFENSEKQRVYQQMATLLLGSKNSIFSFNSVNYYELFFVLLKRRIYKDEIKKGNTTIIVRVSGTGAGALADTLTLTDNGAASAFTVGPSGDEAPLFSGSTQVGRVYYNAGIIAFATGVFLAPTATNSVHWSGSAGMLNTVPVTGNLDSIVYGLRQHIVNDGIQFLNQTNLHSTTYFCRALNSDFNYSTNPTFVDSDGRILPTSGTDNQTRTYPTKIGLYDINDNVLAVASLSEPVKKSPDSEIVTRVRLSFGFALAVLGSMFVASLFNAGLFIG